MDEKDELRKRVKRSLEVIQQQVKYALGELKDLEEVKLGLVFIAVAKTIIQ